MLPKQERLTKSSEFAFIYRQKKSVANSLLILYLGSKKQNVETPTRVGFIVAKKVHKRAVKRNRIKRLMRESYKNITKTEGFKLKDYQSLIFIARPAIIESDYNSVHAALLDCIKKANRKFINNRQK